MKNIVWFVWRHVAKALMHLLKPELGPMLKEILKEQDLLRVRKVDWTDVDAKEDGTLIADRSLMKRSRQHAKESIESEDEQLRQAGADLR